jgi:hypothetical protein
MVNTGDSTLDAGPGGKMMPSPSNGMSIPVEVVVEFSPVLWMPLVLFESSPANGRGKMEMPHEYRR